MNTPRRSRGSATQPRQTPNSTTFPLTGLELSASISLQSMSWYYGVDGQQQGPVEETELETLESSGAIEWSTPIWQQGMIEWRPFGEIFKRASVLCHGCKRKVDPEPVVRYRNLYICARCKTLFFQKVREGLASEQAAQYCGFWIRLAARLLDGLLLLIVRGPLIVFNQTVILRMYPLPASGGRMSGFGNTAQLGNFLTLEAAYFLVGLILSLAYEVFFVGRFGGTPGKLLLRMRIVRPDFSKVTYGRAAIRFFGLGLSDLTMFVGYLMVVFDPERRALHDYLADTRVIKHEKAVVPLSE
jgi:uncharacterized RDD family membrane protein YckC